MDLNFNSLMFFFVMVMGVTISLSSNNWMSIWLGLEISLMTFIPFISNKSKLNSETSFKYYIIQSMSSTIMMMGIIMNSFNMKFYSMLMFGSIMIKLGVIPFHIWMLSIIEGLNYNSIMILFSIQKLAPMNLISYLNINMQIIIFVNLIISSLSAMNQNSIKKILCYSSIYNMSLMLSTINQTSIWMLYMIIYSMMNLTMILVFKNENLNFINQILIKNYKMYVKLTMWMLMLSMGGMPPFPMFIMKLMILEELMNEMDNLIILMIMSTSFLIVWFYMRISIISMMFYFLFSKYLIYQKSMSHIIMIMFMMYPFLLTLKSLN